MTDPRVAPYGSWSSPVTPAMLASSSIRLGSTWFDDGLVYWTETRPKEDGRVALVRADAFSSPAEVLPAGTNVRTRVHEYGGGAFAVHRGTIYFSEFTDQRLYRHVPGSGEPVPITPETGGTHRFADGRVTSDGSTWIGVRERHAGERVPQDVTNELVAIRTDGSGEPRVIASGRDFYSDPRIAPDGASVCWLSWDLPWMPWDGCELHEAALAPDGSLGEPRTVAGRDGEESIWQPSWSPAGELYWVSDRSGWWNLERERAGIRETVCPRDAEFGWPHWIFGGSSYAFLGDGRIACHYGSGGVQHTALLDPSTGELVDLDIPHTAVSYPSLVAEGSQIAFIAGGPALPEQVVLLDFTSRAVDVLRESASTEVDPAVFSIPRQLEFPTDGGRTAFAHVYPPTNPGFRAPEGERPPLIVISHGGPTSESTPSFSLQTQFWTSRGFAVVDVNYGGSTGYGRAYRAAAERNVGDPGHRGLHQRCASPRGAGCGRRWSAPDPRRIGRRVHDALCAGVPRRLRRRRQLLRARRPRPVRRRRHAQVRVASTSTRWSAPTPRRPSATGRGVPSTSSTSCGHRCSSSKARRTRSSRRRKRS